MLTLHQNIHIVWIMHCFYDVHIDTMIAEDLLKSSCNSLIVRELPPPPPTWILYKHLVFCIFPIFACVATVVRYLLHNLYIALKSVIVNVLVFFTISFIIFS